MASRDPRQFCSHRPKDEGLWTESRDAAHPRLWGGLFEIRAKGPEGIGRAFFCILVGETIVILHQLIKKSEKTPQTDIETALRRMNEVKHGW